MRVGSVSVVASSALCLLALGFAERQAPPEGVPRARTEDQMLRAVYLPTFRTSAGRLSIGTAFLARVEGKTLLLTAQHLFGETGGLEREYGWDELGDLIQKVEAVSLATEGLKVSTKRVLPIEGAAGYTPERIDGDVAAFRVSGTKAVPFGLGERAPAGGARVFLVARDDETGRSVHAARVLDTPEQGLVYMFDDTLSLRGMSGAPLVDDNGWVVGIHLGGGHQQGQAIGIANPVESLRSQLQQALVAK